MTHGHGTCSGFTTASQLYDLYAQRLIETERRLKALESAVVPVENAPAAASRPAITKVGRVWMNPDGQAWQAKGWKFAPPDPTDCLDFEVEVGGDLHGWTYAELARECVLRNPREGDRFTFMGEERYLGQNGKIVGQNSNITHSCYAEIGTDFRPVPESDGTVSETRMPVAGVPAASTDILTPEDAKLAMRIGRDAAKAHIEEINHLDARVKDLERQLVNADDHGEELDSLLIEVEDECATALARVRELEAGQLHDHEIITEQRKQLADAERDRNGYIDKSTSLIRELTEMKRDRDAALSQAESLKILQPMLDAARKELAAVRSDYVDLNERNIRGRKEFYSTQKALVAAKQQLNPTAKAVDKMRSNSRRG
jgi:hypothetical protein